MPLRRIRTAGRSATTRRIPSARAILRLLLLASVAAGGSRASAQNNYEIQVYGADTVAPRSTMVEVHSNFSVEGGSTMPSATLGADPLYATNHQERETLEITSGINDWAEVGFYVFTAEKSGQGVQWVGDHIRPRVRVPDSWHWPVGASLSMEVGYQRREFSSDTWTVELRPIIDKQIGRWYLATNLAVDRSFHGDSVPLGVTFAPAGKVGYDFSRAISAGIEYYADYGSITAPDSLHNQQQQVFVVSDLNVSPEWEINFGVGIGPTAGTDHLIVKGILGRHFNWGRQPRVGASDSVQ